MNVAERNRVIKKVLKKEFGKISVVNEDGWVVISIYDAEQSESKRCLQEIKKLETIIYKILEKYNLMEELSIYYDDMGIKKYKIIVRVI